ncbi:hypothetical protein C8J57DRAFT_1653232 [Mycena rebaudengoi]|nr:hypothetical protein C8J57DRAFT_1653232 [Mycena rebaudengoi]
MPLELRLPRLLFHVFGASFTPFAPLEICVPRLLFHAFGASILPLAPLSRLWRLSHATGASICLWRLSHAFRASLTLLAPLPRLWRLYHAFGASLTPLARLSRLWRLTHAAGASTTPLALLSRRWRLYHAFGASTTPLAPLFSYVARADPAPLALVTTIRASLGRGYTRRRRVAHLFCHPILSRTGTHLSMKVAETPQACRLLPTHKPYLVVHFEGSFYLDHCYLLGAASLAAITRAKFDIWQVESGPDALSEVRGRPFYRTTPFIDASRAVGLTIGDFWYTLPLHRYMFSSGPAPASSFSAGVLVFAVASPAKPDGRPLPFFRDRTRPSSFTYYSGAVRAYPSTF